MNDIQKSNSIKNISNMYGEKNMETYECESCKRTATVQDDETPPSCCGKPMKMKMPREICLQPTHAEHARPMEDEDACDEFRAGT